MTLKRLSLATLGIEVVGVPGLPDHSVLCLGAPLATILSMEDPWPYIVKIENITCAEDSCEPSTDS